MPRRGGGFSARSIIFGCDCHGEGEEKGGTGGPDPTIIT